MNNSNSIFKFATIRNPSNDINAQPIFQIQPQTGFLKELTDILESKVNQSEKIKLMNQKLDAFIQSINFYKSKSEISDSVNSLFDKIKTKAVLTGTDLTEATNLYKNLYINIVVRSITKSNATEIYNLAVDYIKFIHQKLSSEKINPSQIPMIRVLLPEKLILSFTPPANPVVTPSGENPIIVEVAALNTQIIGLQTQIAEIHSVKKENTRQLRVEQKKYLKLQNELFKAQEITREGGASNQFSNSAIINEPTLPIEISTQEIDNLLEGAETLQMQEEEINDRLTKLNNELFKRLPQTKYTQIGNQWVSVGNLEIPNHELPQTDEEAIVVYANGCYLKFPFQVADLRVVEQKTVGYLPAEIAHINNTQPGELQEKITRRLKRVETFESLITEDETFRETDTQSTEKFSVEKAAAEVTAEEISANVNTSVSGTYGMVTASVDAGFSFSQSSQHSNSSSQSYAKEIVQKVVDRVSNKVKRERSLKTLEEFEETVKHVIDNKGKDEPKSYVYRWLTRLSKATLKNYGKRLIFQIDVAHPSHYYLTRAIQEKAPLGIPPNPKHLKKDSADPIIKDFYQKTGLLVDFSVDNINRNNYLAWAESYNVKLDQPPLEKITLSTGYTDENAEGVLTQKNIVIPKGYHAVDGYIRGLGHGGALIVYIHSSLLLEGMKRGISFYNKTQYFYLPNKIDEKITDNLSVSIYGTIFNVNISINCNISYETYFAWQLKCYHAIIEAYETMKAEAESKMSEWNPNNPGLNPARKNDLIKTELKKGTLSKMFRCNPFWIKDNYVVGKEYDPECCKDSLNAEKVRFLETVFDWNNMTYDLHPYFYANHDSKNHAADNWGKLLNLTDEDPHFEAFLQASYATVRIPVHRDSLKEIAAINFIINNSIANHSVIPASLQHLLDDLDANTPFGYIPENSANADFIDIRKEYDRSGKLKIFYMDNSGKEVICTEREEIDKEGKKTLFYYDAAGKLLISEIKEGINSNGQKYFYYFNAQDKKVICHKAKTEFDIKGNETPYYSVDLGIFHIPTDLVILEAGVQNGVKIKGYYEDLSDPSSDVVIPQQFSPAIIQDK
jgi:hypothetical protein